MQVFMYLKLINIAKNKNTMKHLYFNFTTLLEFLTFY